MRGMVFVLLVAGCGFHIEIGGAGLDAASDDGAAVQADGPGGAADGPSSVDASVDALLGACPAGYGPINGVGMYRVVEGADKAWLEAAGDCDDDDDAGNFTLHTHLVVLVSETERLALTNGTSTVSGNTWIGLSDRGDESEFRWVTDQPTGGYPMVGDEPPWDSDDPDDAGNNEDCVRMKNTSYVLEDKPCADTESYVCECDAFVPNSEQDQK